MGIKASTAICCTKEETFSSNSNQGNNRLAYTGSFRAAADHYCSTADVSLANPSTKAKISRPQSYQASSFLIPPLLFSNANGLTSSYQGRDSSLSLRKNSGNSNKLSYTNNSDCEQKLIESILDFFEESSFKLLESISSSTVMSIDSKLRTHASVAHNGQQYERCSIDLTNSQDTCVYLKQEQKGGAASKYISSVVETTFTNVDSLDQFLLGTNLLLSFEQNKDTIESKKIIYQQSKKHGMTLQVIYVVFSKTNDEIKNKDLMYTKIIKRIDENTCVIAGHSVSLQESPMLEIREKPMFDAFGVEALLGSMNTKSTNKSKQQSPLKKSLASQNSFERAELQLSGQKITFNLIKNTVLFQELSSLDLKNDENKTQVTRDATVHTLKKQILQIAESLEQDSE